MGIPGRIPNDGSQYLHNQRLGKVVVHRPDQLDLRYLYYLFLSKPFNAHLVATATGSKILHTAPSRIESFQWEKPSLEAQNRIASILSAYDDLIENNTKRIKVLEEMARSLYREWFVHYRFPGHESVKMVDSALGKVPEGWKPFRLGALVDDVRDSIDPSEIESDTPYFGLEHLPRRSIALGEWGTASDVQSTKLRVQVGDILFGKIRPYFHKVGVTPVDAVCSSDTIVLRIKSPLNFGVVLCCVSSDEFVQHATQTSQGTKMPRANWEILRQYPVAIPPASILTKFNDAIHSQVEMVQRLVLKNRVLRRTRDMLLPKLISGEIEVDAAGPG